MSYTKLHPNHARMISSLSKGVCCLQNEIGSVTEGIQNNNQLISPLERTPNLLRVTNAGTINVPVHALSVINLGPSSGIFMGQSLEPDLPLNFDAGSLNNVFSAGSFTYDATGTEFLIIFNT